LWLASARSRFVVRTEYSETMGRETVELISPKEPLPKAIAQAVGKLSPSDDAHVVLVFDPGWHPTMEVVDILTRELASFDALETLTLVHPSAAMGVIAAAVASRMPAIQVMSKRSLYDEAEDEETDATESNTFFRMASGESLDAFVRRSVGEAHTRAVRRFALVFDPDSRPTLALADVLVEELVQSGVQEIGLVHPTIRLNAIAASVRLRLATVKIALGSERRSE
jgi:hypothetical protein